MRSKGSLADFLCSLRSGYAFFHNFVDGERLAKQSLALGRLHSASADLGVAHHENRKALGLATLGVVHEDRVFNRHERRKKLTDVIYRHPRIEVSNINFEHRH